MEAGLVIADRIRETIESHQFYPVPLEQLQADGYVPSDREPIKLTTTIGLASFPEHHTTRDGIVMAADIALCRAKYIGRNCVCTYDSAIGGGEMLDPHDFYQMLRDPDAAAVQSLAAAVDARDHYTHGHSERVTDYAMLIADGLGMDDEDRDALKVAGLLHDLGKIGVPDAILNKPGVLTIEEKNTVQSHTSLGGDILRQTHQLDRIIPAVLFHHERWDGSGYPDGLSGPDIPLAARVLAIADSFDAMTSDRPYRTAMSTQAALQELQANAGKQFDPELVDIFVTRMTFLMRDNAA
jgi:putative nucleotidyltransferase with HDIG domain